MENYKNISVNSNIEDAELLDGFHEHEIKDIIAKTKDKFGAEINHFVAVALEKVANEKLKENEKAI